MKKTSEEVIVWYKDGAVHIKSDKGTAKITLTSDQALHLYQGYSVKAVLESDLNIGENDA